MPFSKLASRTRCDTSRFGNDAVRRQPVGRHGACQIGQRHNFRLQPNSEHIAHERAPGFDASPDIGKIRFQLGPALGIEQRDAVLDVRTLYQQARALFAMFTPPEFLGPFLELRAGTLPGGSVSSVSLKGSSAAYYDVGASRVGPLPMLVRASPQSSLQVTVIRTQ